MSIFDQYKHIPGFDKLVQDFDASITANAAEIDESDREDWNSLALGWALGKGLSIVDAQSFAFYLYSRS